MQSEHQAHEHTLSLRDVPKTWTNIPRMIALGIIRLYQLTLSRIFQVNTCRFYPTCSHYGYEALYEYGLFRGGWLALKRILRCQPFHPGGYDPVPLKLDE